MKTTNENTTQADGYNDKNVRECPICHGSGLAMYNISNDQLDTGTENDCPECGGCGITTISEITPQQIKKLRADKAWSQCQLAKHLGMSEAAVQNWEQNRTKISGPALVLLRMLISGEWSPK